MVLNLVWFRQFRSIYIGIIVKISSQYRSLKFVKGKKKLSIHDACDYDAYLLLSVVVGTVQGIDCLDE